MLPTVDKTASPTYYYVFITFECDRGHEAAAATLVGQYVNAHPSELSIADTAGVGYLPPAAQAAQLRTDVTLPSRTFAAKKPSAMAQIMAAGRGIATGAAAAIDRMVAAGMDVKPAVAGPSGAAAKPGKQYIEVDGVLEEVDVGGDQAAMDMIRGGAEVDELLNNMAAGQYHGE